MTILWAKLRIALHTIASVRHESRLKVAVVSVAASGLWIGAFYLAQLGFRFLGNLGGDLSLSGGLDLSELVMRRLLSAFALALSVMLVFSNALIAYSTLYRSREVHLLLLSPISTSTFFLSRFWECVAFSSWASAFLGSPILLAYGLETEASLAFYLALLAFYLPFVTLPAALGTLLAIVGVRLLSKIGQTGRWVSLALIALGTLTFFRGNFARLSFDETPSLQLLAATLGQTQSPWLPSTWTSSGILAAAAGEVEAVFYFLLLTANALMGVWIATLAAERWFYLGWSSQGSVSNSTRRRGLLDALDILLRPVPQPTRSLILKDFKTFWRDPAQWSQFVIFFGIMALYVANLRSFGGQDNWRVWGTLLNLGASMLILASLTTRFVFPLVSLEGRRFWILGLSPVTLRQVMWQKFWLSVVCASVFTVSLAVLSALRLQLDPSEFFLSVAGIVATTVALSGLAVGLGSLYPNFEEDNPARIVSGMGGTLNFLLSMLYIVLVMTGQALVLLGAKWQGLVGEEALPWIVGGVGWILLVTVVTCWVPLRLGLRNLERAEF